MIRKNLLFCKINRIKTSSKSLFDSYMTGFRPELETCPICCSCGNCSIHAYYGRSITDFTGGRREKSDLCILRVCCENCGHTHAILPDIIIPYTGYGLLFVLRVLGEHFAGLHSVDELCELYGISRKQFYKWISLWKSHKQEWLGLLKDAETSGMDFWKYLSGLNPYSCFSSDFIRLTGRSFLQSHKNSQTARYRQTVFAPDISIF
jgi:hypothetical protein